MFGRTKLSLLVVILTMLVCCSNVQANQLNQGESDTGPKKRNLSPVSSSITIKAPLERVWSSIHKARSKDPELTNYSVLITEGNREIAQQTMMLPFIGEARCIVSLDDSPPNRIDYRLIESNSFKTFDGTWLLSSVSKGQATRIDLTCYSELKEPVPQFILKAVTARKMRKRLDFVKMLAEKKEDPPFAKSASSHEQKLNQSICSKAKAN
jgi:Polyketide cyclase / dehydrase and lipid transport